MSLGFEAALREAARVLAALAVPVLLAVLAAGIVTGLLQGVTRVRDRSISVAPRLVAVGVTLIMCGAWSASRLVELTQQMLRSAVIVAATPPPK